MLTQKCMLTAENWQGCVSKPKATSMKVVRCADAAREEYMHLQDKNHAILHTMDKTMSKRPSAYTKMHSSHSGA